MCRPIIVNEIFALKLCIALSVGQGVAISNDFIPLNNKLIPLSDCGISFGDYGYQPRNGSRQAPKKSGDGKDPAGNFANDRSDHVKLAQLARGRCIIAATNASTREPPEDVVRKYLFAVQTVTADDVVLDHFSCTEAT